MIRAILVSLFLLVAVTACGGEAGRQPPENARESPTHNRNDDGWRCGGEAPELVWYPPTEVIVVGVDALVVPRSRFRCPRSSGFGTGDLAFHQIVTDDGTLDVYVNGASDNHGVAEISATFKGGTLIADVMALEPDWYRIEVPMEADAWIVRIDLVTELEWEASYIFSVTGG